MLRPTAGRSAPAKAAHPSPYLTLPEAAAYCRLATQTILNHRREIRAVKSRPLLFTCEALDQWLHSKRGRRAR